MPRTVNDLDVHLRGDSLAQLHLRFKTPALQKSSKICNELLARILDTNTPAGMALLLLPLPLLLRLIGANTLLVL
jgi:hypothetical protein